MAPVTQLELNAEQLEALLERAAKRGAREALESIGLHDDSAIKDVQELRGLLDAWRGTKSTMFRTLTQAITMLVLGALCLGVMLQLKGGK